TLKPTKATPIVRVTLCYPPTSNAFWNVQPRWRNLSWRPTRLRERRSAISQWIGSPLLRTLQDPRTNHHPNRGRAGVKPASTLPVPNGNAKQQGLRKTQRKRAGRRWERARRPGRGRARSWLPDRRWPIASALTRLFFAATAGIETSGPTLRRA